MQDLFERFLHALEFGLVGKTMHKVDEVVALKDLKKLTLNILKYFRKLF